jgi:hypothetical protein
VKNTYLALPAVLGLLALGTWSAQAQEADPTLVPGPAPSSVAPAPGPVDDSGPTTGRPQFHLGDTEAYRTEAQVAYNQCLLDHGARRNTGREGVAMAAAPGEDADGNPVGPLVLEPVPASASAACLGALPVMPPELDAATNPRFAEQAQDYVGCLRDGGLYVELLNDHNPDWTYAEGHPVPRGSYRLEDECLVSAFSS